MIGESGSTGGCVLESPIGDDEQDPDEWLEETVWQGLRMWHVIFLSIGIALSFVILLCCCFKFRIPRTKQEIEGDYIRRKIMRKFRKRLKAIQNQELDEMDLKKALDKIRTELKSDTESLQQSDVLSGATLSSAAMAPGSTYRRASQIQIDISLEDLRIQSMGLGARIVLAISRIFGRSTKPFTPARDVVDVEEGNVNNSADGEDKPTVALLSDEGEMSKKEDLNKRKKTGGKSKEASSSGTFQCKDSKDNSKKVINCQETKVNVTEVKVKEGDSKSSDNKKTKQDREKKEKSDKASKDAQSFTPSVVGYK